MNEMLEVNGPKLRRYREASEWLLRLHEPGAPEEEVDAWLHWCEVDGENLAAFERVQQDWDDTGGFKHAPELLPASKAVRWDAGHGAGLPFAGPRCRQPRLRPRGGHLWREPGARGNRQVNCQPATLPDGSSLLLSAKASADVDFTGAARHIALRPGAEAYMKVHHDKARPFIVGPAP